MSSLSAIDQHKNHASLSLGDNKNLKRKLLVIDDDRTTRAIVDSAFRGHPELEVVGVGSGEEALRTLESVSPVVCLLDIYLPGINGLELFRKLKALDRKLPIIFITSDSASDTAIEAMRVGAFDYLSKPLNLEQLRNLVGSAVAARQLMDEPIALQIGEPDASGEQFVGRSQAMIEVFKQIGRVAAQNVTVLIRGESGCGKELVARALVQHSDRSDQPYVAVNCAAIPDQLLESELFGHEKGAFTGADKRRTGRFEQCDGGTILLDEVGDMASIVQGKVLRLLQEQRFERVGGNESITTNVRIIAATNRPLEQMVEDGTFREDLLYRLNGFTINLPPLRDRREDIPLLLEYFLRRAKGEMRKSDLRGISPVALEMLVGYTWPGNVRQLQSVVRQAVLRTTGTVVTPQSLPDFIPPVTPGGRPAAQITKPPAPPAEETQVDDATTAGDGTPPPYETNRSDSEASRGAAISSAPTAPDSSTAGHSYQWSPPAVDTSALMIPLEPPAPIEQLPLSEAIRYVDRYIDDRLSAGSTDLYSETMDLVEKYLFTRVLESTGGNQSKTAEILGITRGKVRDRIASFNINIDKSS